MAIPYPEPDVSSKSPKLRPMFSHCPKCGALFTLATRLMNPMVSDPTLAQTDQTELSLGDLAKHLPMAFSDNGTYIGKMVQVNEDGSLRIANPKAEEDFPSSRFVYFLSGSVTSTEPATLMLMPIWFEEVPRFADQLGYYESKIRPLLEMLANRRVSEAPFLALLRRHAQDFPQTSLRKIWFLKEELEAELAKIKVALEAMEARRALGESSDQEYLLKQSMLSQIKTYVEFLLGQIDEVSKRTPLLSKQINELVNQGSLSTATASEAVAVTSAFGRTGKAT
jgi:hypothetical protein